MMTSTTLISEEQVRQWWEQRYGIRAVPSSPTNLTDLGDLVPPAPPLVAADRRQKNHQDAAHALIALLQAPPQHQTPQPPPLPEPGAEESAEASAEASAAEASAERLYQAQQPPLPEPGAEEASAEASAAASAAEASAERLYQAQQPPLLPAWQPHTTDRASPVEAVLSLLGGTSRTVRVGDRVVIHRHNGESAGEGIVVHLRLYCPYARAYLVQVQVAGPFVTDAGMQMSEDSCMTVHSTFLALCPLRADDGESLTYYSDGRRKAVECVPGDTVEIYRCDGTVACTGQVRGLANTSVPDQVEVEVHAPGFTAEDLTFGPADIPFVHLHPSFLRKVVA